MTYRIQCQCGRLVGQLSQPERALRGVCYCKDCRAYSNHLGSPTTHDALGGADFLATQAKYVSFSEGTQHLACVSLSEKGLLRWYTSCCNTAIGNTLRSWRVPYVSLVHTCLRADPAAYERAFPTLHLRLNTSSAKQPPPGLAWKTTVSLAGFIPKLMASGVTGGHRPTPFFRSPDGVPVAAVRVLTPSERAQAYAPG